MEVRMSHALEQLQFDNHFLRELPADPETGNHRRQVTGACYSYVQPTPVRQPELLAYSAEMAAELGLSGQDCEHPLFTRVFAGNALLPGMQPYAMCYGGHQFGNWAGQLGDGRAINLGHAVTPSGERLELQLKGAGATPYSRHADGRAVLRSSIREFLCSEAMRHLGVPTTRALSLVATGEQVIRDMFYDGRPRPEPGAVVCRVAPGFLRIGNFELLAARGEHPLLKELADYTLRHYFPDLGEPGPDAYLAFFDQVCRRTVALIVDWMRVGFVHGVMNTDNISILGLTIDYGPYGWIDDFNPDWTPNTTDAEFRRYRFGAQPQVALWNLVQLANALYPLIQQVEPLEAVLRKHQQAFNEQLDAMWAAKLGLQAFRPDADDAALIRDLQKTLTLTETDMTIFFRLLPGVDVERLREPSTGWREALAPLMPAWYRPEELELQGEAIVAWLRRHAARLQEDGLPPEQRREQMNRVNPKYVLRNYMAQQAIDASEQGDHTLVHELLDVLRRPYDEQPRYEHWFARRPDWARTRPGCSMLSCSS
ncbi:MAG: YdiU family protein [Ectothiorhodospiraceae bacterium]|nr:YdiU family protein [Ectothiorhodospiraceae bacterium]